MDTTDVVGPEGVARKHCGGDELLERLVAAGRVIPPRSRPRCPPPLRVEIEGATISDLLRDQRR